MRNWKIFSALLFFTLLITVFLRGANASDSSSIKVGDKAPDFTLPTQDGGNISLRDYAGEKTVVLYFYPKDNTPGCTKEACGFRDAYEDFKKAGAEVLGVSSDSEKSHQEFAGEYKLPFKLLADKDGALRKTYGVPSSKGVFPGRVTYVIDKTGVVRLVFNSQLEPGKHVTEALSVIKEFSK
jgi:thioredoxin-dependent peroxiredoxin